MGDKSGKNVTITLITCLMELCWLHAWAVFAVKGLLGVKFPFAGTFMLFIIAVLLVRISRGRGLRVVTLGFIYIAGFCCAFAWIIQKLYYPSFSFLKSTWLTIFFQDARTATQWVIFAVVVILCVIIWFGGMSFARRPRSYNAISLRFDAGISAFLGLFLTSMLLQVKGNIVIENTFSLSAAISFLCLGLLAVGFSRDETSLFRRFLPKHQIAGIIVSFSLVISLVTAVVIFFLFPLLIEVTGSGYRTVSSAVDSVMPIIGSILGFLFTGRRIRQDPADSSIRPQETAYHTPPGTWMELIEKVLAWGIKGLAIIALLSICTLVLFFIIRLLLRKTARTNDIMEKQWSFFQWLKYIMMSFIRGFKGIPRRFKKRTSAAQYYEALQSWSTHSGMYRAVSETPHEFALRLSERLAPLKSEIHLVVSLFNREAYAEVKLPVEDMKALHVAWKKLVSPVYWWLRLRTKVSALENKEPAVARPTGPIGRSV